MNKVVKRVGIGAAALVAILLLCAGTAFLIGNARIQATHGQVGHDLVLPTDSASIATGERLASAYGCRECHGDDLGGTMMIEDAAFATLPAPNLTAGQGGVGSSNTPADWERAIRHGVGADGRTLFIMPSGSYAELSDRDIAEIVAYLQTVPPVSRTFPEPSFGPMARVAALTAPSEVVPASVIDHAAPHPATLERGPTPAYGAYLARVCTGCHGADFSGAPPGMGSTVAAANLTPDPTTGLGSWTGEDFRRALTTGVRPDGTEIDGAYMPWQPLSSLTDEEIEAIWVFLQSLEPVEADRRSE